MRAVLSLGSNVPRGGMTPTEILRAALSCLAECLADLRASSVYRTKPLYYRAQDDFFNLVCAGEFPRGAEDLLALTQGIEARFGRDRTREIPKGPRPLDIDIVLFGDLAVSTRNLVIPHPRAKERAFVLVPLLEILPDSADPISGEKYRTFLDRLDTTGVELIHEN
jgi:2-amino-4-hydroxy-6-hydroxymethyldihydropteridine diphosphokinase